jgi:sodium-dependent phosphate cotransporter
VLDDQSRYLSRNGLLNIGTSVTSTIVSLAHIRNTEQLERAFTAGTVHDMFNFMTVAILFPWSATGYLKAVTGALVDGAEATVVIRGKDPSKVCLSSEQESDRSNSSSRVPLPNAATFFPIECDVGGSKLRHMQTGLIACNKRKYQVREYTTTFQSDTISVPT